MRLGGSHRFERAATALVVLAVAVASLAAAFHSHPLEISPDGSHVADSRGECHALSPAGCWACRLSHDNAPGPAVPPIVTGRLDGPVLRAVGPEAPAEGPVRGPRASRAPPLS